MVIKGELPDNGLSSSQTDPVPGDTAVLFQNPFDLVTCYLTKSLKVAATGGIIREKIDLCPTGQVSGAFFKAQNRKGAYQTDGVDLVYVGLISQGERSRCWFVQPTTSQTG